MVGAGFWEDRMASCAQGRAMTPTNKFRYVRRLALMNNLDMEFGGA
jgi:hypothetical protein